LVDRNAKVVDIVHNWVEDNFRQSVRLVCEFHAPLAHQGPMAFRVNKASQVYLVRWVNQDWTDWTRHTTIKRHCHASYAHLDRQDLEVLKVIQEDRDHRVQMDTLDYLGNPVILEELAHQDPKAELDRQGIPDQKVNQETILLVALASKVQKVLKVSEVQEVCLVNQVPH